MLRLFAVEEIFKDQSLILFEDYIFSADESWKKSEVFGWHIAFVAWSFFEERINEIINGFSLNHSFDRDWIIFEYWDKCLLNESLIDSIWMLQKQLNPSWEIDLVIDKVLHYFLYQNVTEFKDLSNFDSPCFILRYGIIAQDLNEWFIKSKNDFNYQLSNTCLN